MISSLLFLKTNLFFARKYKLTCSGKQLAEHVKAVGDLMVTEIMSLNLLAKKLTEKKVEEVVDQWRIKDAENQ